MQYTKNFTELGKGDAQIAGGKGASLGEMTQAGILVPGGFVVLASTFDAFLKETDLVQEIDAILDGVNHEAIHTVEVASENIQALILSRPMPEAMQMEIQEKFQALGSQYVAVRSSATAEDGAEHAWAGQLDSFLNTTESDLIEKVRRCWASLFTPRAIFYRFEKGLQSTNISVAVVVQKMVNSEKSGIAFSVHPVTEDYNQLIIEAGFGLGEAIVSGSVTPDSYVVEKSPWNILDINVSHQSRALYRVEGGGSEWKNLSETEGNSQVLNENQIQELSDIIVCIENHYGFPCDIEWAAAFEKSEGPEELEGQKLVFYIVQSRPITTLALRDDTDSGVVRILKGEKKLDIDNYQKLFQWPGEFSYFLSSYFMAVYNKHGAISLHDGRMWQSFLPLIVKEKTLREGLELYSSQERYRDLWDGLVKEYRNLEEQFLEAFGKSRLEKEEVRSLLDNALRHYTYYSQTEFFFTDLAYVEQEKCEQIQKNFQTFDDLKIRGRESLNAIALAPGCYLDRLLEKVGDQYSVSLEDLKRYSLQEMMQLFEGIYLDQNSLVARDTYLMHGKGESSEIIVGQEALNKIKDFLVNKGFKKELKGQVASRGKYSGKARVFRFSIAEINMIHEEIEKMEQGEILVADTTAPEIILACKKAGAIVTNQGGMMSHAAIVARELNIPCVVGTGYITEIVKTGDAIEVNADNGMVTILEKAEESI